MTETSTRSPRLERLEGEKSPHCPDKSNCKIHTTETTLRIGRGGIVNDDVIEESRRRPSFPLKKNQRLGKFNLVVFNQRGTDGFAQRLVEGEDYTTTQDDLVRLGQERLDDTNLWETFEPIDDGANGLSGFLTAPSR